MGWVLAFYFFSIADPVLPKYFYVPKSALEDERANPGSQHRVASNDGSCNNDLHIWGQSMLIISDLLTSHLLSVHELDPIRRHLPSYSRPKLDSRYSAFEVITLQLIHIMIAST